MERAQRCYNEELAKATATTAKEIVVKKHELTTAQQDLAAAKQQAERANRELEAAKTEVARETTSAKLLARFIDDRALSADYRKHLGVLAQWERWPSKR